ncbi:MAG: MaoC family dehydratase [Acidobacteria bacterium]|nr:MaoC family dehydratase [Acidobacteriota bacterium]
MSEQKIHAPQYGRWLDDFRVGEIFHHLWEVTLDDGLLGLCAAAFLDPNPLYASRRFACETGFRERVVQPLVLMNLALSASVHDVSEQAIAHLAYINLRFPNAAYVGDTLSFTSQVVSVRVSDSKPDRGVVHVRTTGLNQDGLPVVTFERKALIPAGKLANRAHPDSAETVAALEAANPVGANVAAPAEVILPNELASEITIAHWPGRPRGGFEDFAEGDIYLHSNGRTIGESEHMQLTMLTRNSHPLHFDAVYARERSFMQARVVCGPLVFAWVASLASRDTTANALWDLGYDKGTHPAPVLAGDTLFAASKVLETRQHDEQTGIVKFHLVGVKNDKPAALMQTGTDLFQDKFAQKVFEIEREVLLPKRRAVKKSQ